MLIQSGSRMKTATEMNEVYKFKKEEGTWCIELTETHDWNLRERKLRMTQGAQRFLNYLSDGFSKLRLQISLTPKSNAGVLELVEHCNTQKGGAYYRYFPGEIKKVPATFWICDFALVIFGDMPERIYISPL